MRDDEKREASFRLMQALSGVDEELLERSERKADPGVRRMARRWGYALAACLTLAVAGTSVYCVNRFGTGGYSGADNSMDFAMQGVIGAVADTAGAWDKAEIAEEAAAAQDTKGTEKMEAAQDNAEAWEGIEALRVQEEGLTQVQELMWEQATALEDLGSHVPTLLPADYSLQRAVYGKGAEGQDVLLLYFADGQDGLLLRLEETTEGREVQSAVDYPVYRETEDWQAHLPEADRGGQVRFGLLLDDGTLIRYQGALSADELCELLDSSIR